MLKTAFPVSVERGITTAACPFKLQGDDSIIFADNSCTTTKEPLRGEPKLSVAATSREKGGIPMDQLGSGDWN